MTHRALTPPFLTCFRRPTRRRRRARRHRRRATISHVQTQAARPASPCPRSQVFYHIPAPTTCADDALCHWGLRGMGWWTGAGRERHACRAIIDHVYRRTLPFSSLIDPRDGRSSQYRPDDFANLTRRIARGMLTRASLRISRPARRFSPCPRRLRRSPRPRDEAHDLPTKCSRGSGARRASATNRRCRSPLSGALLRRAPYPVDPRAGQLRARPRLSSHRHPR